MRTHDTGGFVCITKLLSERVISVHTPTVKCMRAHFSPNAYLRCNLFIHNFNVLGYQVF